MIVRDQLYHINLILFLYILVCKILACKPEGSRFYSQSGCYVTFSHTLSFDLHGTLSHWSLIIPRFINSYNNNNNNL